MPAGQAPRQRVNTDVTHAHVPPFFLAAIESTGEGIQDALCLAETMRGFRSRVVEALPLGSMSAGGCLPSVGSPQVDEAVKRVQAHVLADQRGLMRERGEQVPASYSSTSMGTVATA